MAVRLMLRALVRDGQDLSRTTLTPACTTCSAYVQEVHRRGFLVRALKESAVCTRTGGTPFLRATSSLWLSQLSVPVREPLARIHTGTVGASAHPSQPHGTRLRGSRAGGEGTSATSHGRRMRA
jgi:hypothetical protein